MDKVDHHILREKNSADDRNLRERPDRYLVQTGYGAVGPAAQRADQAGQTVAKEHDGEPGDNLIDAQEDDEECEQQRNDGGREHGDKEGDTRIAAELKFGGDAGEGPDEHEALSPERQHAGPLADDQAERGKRIRRGKAGRAGQPIDDKMQHEFSLLPHPVNPMPHQKLRRSDADDDDRLNELNHGERDLIEHLKAAAADEQDRHQHGDDHRSYRIVAGQKGDQNSGKAVAFEIGLREPALLRASR